MDFVTFLRVLLRRWGIVLPGVVLTLLTVLFARASVAPEYEAEGSVLLLGPSTASSSQGAVAVNPYLNIPSSLDSTAVILAETMRSEQIMHELADLGASADYEIEPTAKTPILTVTAKGSSMEQVLQTAQLVIQRAQDDLAARQEAAGAPKETFIRSQVLRPPRGTVHSGSRPRVMAAVGAVGMGLTVMLAFAVETLAGWRKRWREHEAAVVPWLPPAVPASEVPFVFSEPETKTGQETAHSNGWHPQPSPGPMVDVFADPSEPVSVEDPVSGLDSERVQANNEVQADEASGENGNTEQPDGLVDAWWSAWERRQTVRRDAQDSRDDPGEHREERPEASRGAAATANFAEVSVEDDQETIHRSHDEVNAVDQAESRDDGDQEEKSLAAWGGSIEVLGASVNHGLGPRPLLPSAGGTGLVDQPGS